MAVIITDMEMPKNCDECPISRYQELHDCPILRMYSTKHSEKRLDDCPLKEVKECKAEDCISRTSTLRPYETLNDNDVIAVWLIRKNIEQQLSVYPKSENSVLEDIKAEIKEMRSKRNCSCSDCLDIIDRYIGEKNVRKR